MDAGDWAIAGIIAFFVLGLVIGILAALGSTSSGKEPDYWDGRHLDDPEF